jgi:hypothetical protein
MFPEVKPAPDWHKEARCSAHPDPEMWWYEWKTWKDEAELQVLRLTEALTLCDECPVKAQCLAQGLEDENIEHKGIWGGMFMSERVRLLNPKNVRVLRNEGGLVQTVRERYPLKK